MNGETTMVVSMTEMRFKSLPLRRKRVDNEEVVESTSARLVLLCAQNAIRMGARTQLSLCPPGDLRKSLQSALRSRNLSKQQNIQNMTRRTTIVENNGQLHDFVGLETLEDYEEQEEDFLLRTNILDDDDSDDEKSTGDEDELLDIDYYFSEESIDLDDETLYSKIADQLYTPFSIANGANNQSNKLPFNWRKVPFFDSITSEETTRARSYLKCELRRAKKRTAILLARQLRKVQERRRETPSIETLELDYSVTKFEHHMTPAQAASLLCESLALDPYESIEGMAACYDGIVRAGVAVLDAPDPTQLSRSRASRSEIMAALAPLLITNLEQESGEVILHLAKLRRLCATPRYQRRFVQRIAPLLVRPPGAAMWCLKHQNDMEAILAATELILDAAFEIFCKGWYERGRWMLADSHRAETLDAAAQQLRSLSSSVFLHPRRKFKKDETSEMAEWEVIAVDRHIRIAISSVLRTDWTQPASHEPFPRPMRSRGSSLSSRRTPVSDVRSAAPKSPRSSSPCPTTPIPEFSSPEFAPFTPDRPKTPPPSKHHAPSPITTDESLTLSPKQSPFASVAPPKSPKMSPKRATMTAREPLSPSTSSVGTSASSELVTFRPNTSRTPPIGPHYRMLTSTAAERRRTVAACRALRAQISRFEEAFVQLHGRHPKGAADRAPLATTYAQYREWKRAIRADAACRIQALFRGALCRHQLLRMSDPAITRVILKRAGRGQESPLNRISLPEDMVNSEDTVAANDWRGTTQREAAVPVMPDTMNSAPASRPSSELGGIPIAELQARKRDLKQQLKQYDVNFVQLHNRMPVKSEKEPIRHLYEAYNRLKNEINRMEQEGQHVSPASPTPVPLRAMSPLSSASDEESPTRNSLPIVRNRRAMPPAEGQPDLAALRAEKQTLHMHLRAYERQFFRENRRQVSSFTDIRPVASQYRRYKEIKRAIAALQQQQANDSNS